MPTEGVSNSMPSILYSNNNVGSVQQSYVEAQWLVVYQVRRIISIVIAVLPKGIL